MQQRIKKAACYAALIYCSGAGLLFGMLRAAQQTRRTLYGGQPVMAQYTEAGSVSLGGGEWTLTPELPDLAERADALGSKLPPCTAKCVLRALAFCETLADQTAEKLRGGSV